MEKKKREIRVTLPELALLVGTRALAGSGLGLLLGSRLESKRRKSVGWTLFAIGALSTIPLAFRVFADNRLSKA